MMKKECKKFKVATLGCRTNQYETQAYQDQLVSLGYTPAQEGEEADICIINTCTVTESADSSSRHEIRKLARQNPNARIVVTGCSVEQQPETIKSIAGVTDIVPNAKKEELIATLFPDIENLPEFSIKQFEAHTRAFVKVQDGCNSFCTYCIIPYVRGRSRSRSSKDILKEVSELVANGYREIVLTGINIGDYDGGGDENLGDLVRMVDSVDGVERLRLSSIDPDEVDDNLLSAVIEGKNTCHSMHIVLQSGSNVILKRMNRKYTRQMFIDTIDRLKKASSDFTFTTDIIVGFPGETERDHLDTLEVMDEVEFAKVHMFPYSDRPRTRSNLYSNKVPEEIKKIRKQEVMRKAEAISYKLREKFVGRRMWVLTESHNQGHTGNFLNVLVDSEPNRLLEVDLIANGPEGLIGQMVNQKTYCA